MAGGAGGMFVLENRRYEMLSKSGAMQGLINSSNTPTKKRKRTVMSGLRFVVKSKKKAESLGQQTQSRLS